MRQRIFSFAAVLALSASLVACSDNSSGTTATTSNDSMSGSTANPAPSTPASTPAAEQGVMVGGSMMVPSKDIVDNASTSNDHTTLVAAVQAAGLVETLKGAGPFTVFAPTNEAFNKVPKSALDDLMKPENKTKLQNVLKYHVVSGNVKAADLQDGQKIKTVQGEELTVTKKDGKVMINGATVTIPDVISSNGVTHVIDAVLMPKK